MASKRPTPALPRILPDVRASVEALNRALYQELIGVAQSINAIIDQLDGFMEGTVAATGPILLAAYTTGALPDPTDWEGAIVYDTTTNTVKFSNGIAWASL